MIVIAAFLLLNCQKPSIITPSPVDKQAFSVPAGLSPSEMPLKKWYTPVALHPHAFPFIHVEDAVALGHTASLLESRFNRNYRVGDLEFSSQDLDKTRRILQHWQFTEPAGIEKSLEAHQIKGKNGSGEVRFTAYFTPEFEVRTKATGRFQYPVVVGYKRKGTNATGKPVSGLSIKTFYTDDKKAVASLRLQGSGYLVFSKNRKVLIEYVSNPDRYISKRAVFASEKSHVNVKPESYNASRNFFLASAVQRPNGALRTELTPFRSIAVDPKFIPLGSILLAEVPYRGPGGELLYQRQLLYAHDTGGSINGAAHVDIYYGTGDQASRNALRIHHPGKLYLLLPKEKVVAKP